ncbi:alpha/beta hydrolase family protein [Streptomyces sp. NPDC001156]
MLGGRTFRIHREFLDDSAGQPQAQRIARLGVPLLVMHPPADTLVGIDNVRVIFDAARHPKSFVVLDGADHLLTRPRDAQSRPTCSPRGAHATQDGGRAHPATEPGGGSCRGRSDLMCSAASLGRSGGGWACRC